MVMCMGRRGRHSYKLVAIVFDCWRMEKYLWFEHLIYGMGMAAYLEHLETIAKKEVPLRLENIVGAEHSEYKAVINLLSY
ncbi:hypothetical protein HYU22_01355 [Candidatus Woesearchaeota archaeon]|nr:hypothetical protein [Candidatus Woesearchaeota archaeon]